MKKPLIRSTLFLFAVALSFRMFCGIFVMQAIGPITESSTIIYWRAGMDIPFVSSADGILKRSQFGVSSLGRGLVISKFAEPVQNREIFRFGYSKMFYLWSTGGQTFDDLKVTSGK